MYFSIKRRMPNYNKILYAIDNIYIVIVIVISDKTPKHK
jgi:hypothetical protein